MADRTYYYQLAFEGGDLQDVRQAADDAFGLTANDLTEAEKDARDWILRMLTSKFGWSAANEWDTEWVDENETYPDHVPRCIRMLAQKIGSAIVWQKLERYNRQVEQTDEGKPLLMSQVLWREAKELWESIVSAGVIIYEDGTDAIDLTAATGTSGYGISGSDFLFFADYDDETSDGVYPEFSTEGLFKELNAVS